MSENKEENSQSSPPEEEINIKSVGDQLREAREARGLTLNNASEGIRIAPKVLQSIEDGKMEDGPALVFMRGFARSYAHYLGIDSPEMNDRINELYKAGPGNEQKLKPCLPIQEQKETHTARNAITLLVVLLGAYLFYMFYFMDGAPLFDDDNQTIVEQESSVGQPVNEDHAEDRINDEQTQEKTETAENDTPQAPEVKQEPNASTESVDQEITESDSGKDEIEVASPETAPAETTIPELPAAPDKIQIPEVEEQVVAESLKLDLEVTQDTWISLSVDDNELEDIRLVKGERYSREAKHNYYLTIGNTEVIRALLNGKEIEMDRTNHLLTDWVVDASQLP